MSAIGASALITVLLLVAQPDRLAELKDPAVRATVAEAVAQAAALGLPGSPLVAKALEGQLKQAPPDRIRLAVDALVTRLATARRALGPAAGDAELAAGADALAAGVAPAALAALRQAWPERPLTLPLGVLTELVTRGVDPARATRQVLALLARGASPQQLVSLGQDVEGDVRRGRAANAALDLRVRGLLGVLSPPPSSTAVPARP
jgi:hypothetical protein